MYGVSLCFLLHQGGEREYVIFVKEDNTQQGKQKHYLAKLWIYKKKVCSRVKEQASEASPKN